MAGLGTCHSTYRALAMLRMGGLVRASGHWRFGLTRVSDACVERLISAGRARIEGDRILKVEAAE